MGGVTKLNIYLLQVGDTLRKLPADMSIYVQKLQEIL